MATGAVVTDEGKKIVLNRTFKTTPDYSIPDEFKIGTGTTTPARGDTDLETPVSIDGDNFKDVDSGYPILTEGTLNAETRCIVLTTEANGNTITEFGLVNSDSSRKLFSHAVFTGITKTNTVQIILTERDQIQ